MEISWGLSKPLQEANLSWRSQGTFALSPLASNKPDAEWTSTWPFVNAGPRAGIWTPSHSPGPHRECAFGEDIQKKGKRKKGLRGCVRDKEPRLGLNYCLGSHAVHPKSDQSWKTDSGEKMAGLCSLAMIKTRRLKG